MDRPEAVRLLEVRDEAEGIKTIRLDKRINAKPGQFVMLWLPGIGEKPFSMSGLGEKTEISFDIRGEFTKALAEMPKGGLVGVRGPYGNGWDLKGKKNVCIVAGGLGLAPFMPIIESMKCTVIYGARGKKHIMFRRRLKQSGNDVVYTTDDGSFGKRGYASDMLDEILKSGSYDAVLTCGPEPLMKKVVDICLRKATACQASLERFMKCGIGICGACSIDPSGLRVCKDGPVFTAEQLANTEFGSYRRDKSGAKKVF